MMKYIYKAIDFLKMPAKSFDSIKGVKLGEAFKFVLVVAIVFAVLNGIAAGLMGTYASMMLPEMGAMLLPVVIIGAIVGGYIGVIIFLTIWGLWLHLWAYIFGARKGLEQTMKAVYYGNSPAYLLGWIPLISIVFTLWSLVLEVIGLKRLQGMETGKAALAMIIAIVIPAAIAFVALATIIAPFLAGMGTLGGLGSYIV
jgi:hypothetical protein